MWDKLDWELWRVVAKQMGPVAVLELLVELPGDVALVGGLIPRSALHEELADPFSLETVSEHELEEPVELARDCPFKLTRYLLLLDTHLSQLTQRHVTDVLEHMFQRYFVTPTLANGGLAAQRRMGRPLSDRWNAAAASALCADLGRVFARAQPRGEPVPQLDAALVRMELHEDEWESVYCDPARPMYDPRVVGSLTGLSHEFTRIVRSKWVVGRI